MAVAPSVRCVVSIYQSARASDPHATSSSHHHCTTEIAEEDAVLDDSKGTTHGRPAEKARRPREFVSSGKPWWDMPRVETRTNTTSRPTPELASRGGHQTKTTPPPPLESLTNP